MNNIMVALVVLSGLFSWYQWDRCADAEKKLGDAVSNAAQAQVAKTLCQGNLDSQSKSISEWESAASEAKSRAESAARAAQIEVDRQAGIIDTLRRTPATTCDEVRLKMEGDALSD